MKNPPDGRQTTCADPQYILPTKERLDDLLSDLRQSSHFIFALIYRLPEHLFAIIRYYDGNTKIYESANDFYTLREYYENVGQFHPNDRFWILFGDYMLTEGNELTTSEFVKLHEYFLQMWCEKRLRENKPVCLTGGLIRKFGLALNDVLAVRKCLAECNAFASARIQAEYDVLKALNCVKK